MRTWTGRNKQGNVTFTDETGNRLLLKSVPDADYPELHGPTLIIKIVAPKGTMLEIALRRGDYVQLIDVIHYWIESNGTLPELLNSSRWLQDEAAKIAAEKEK